jgi:hypothetical protein
VTDDFLTPPLVTEWLQVKHLTVEEWSRSARIHIRQEAAHQGQRAGGVYCRLTGGQEIRR